MKKFLLLVFCIIGFNQAFCYEHIQLINNKKLIKTQQSENTEQKVMLTGSVSLSDQVPKGFFGSWKVIAVQTQTTTQGLFDEYAIDFWNLYKVADVITLENPVSGASASITVDEVQGNTIKFTRQGKSGRERVTETPVLTLNTNNEIFTGTDKIIIETIINNEVVKVDTVLFKVKGYKMYGNSIHDIILK